MEVLLSHYLGMRFMEGFVSADAEKEGVVHYVLACEEG